MMRRPTVHESQLPKDLDPPFPGWVREWVRCKKCGNIYANDYQPHSLSNPIKVVPCGHSYDYDIERVDVISD